MDAENARVKVVGFDVGEIILAVEARFFRKERFRKNTDMKAWKNFRIVLSFFQICKHSGEVIDECLERSLSDGNYKKCNWAKYSMVGMGRQIKKV